MVLSMFQFVFTTFLAVVCARAISLGEGDIPVLAMLIPALWIMPERKIAGAVMIVAMTAYGFTLPNQPASVSIAVWIIMPLLMVIFSKRSSVGVVWTAALIVVTLQIGLMVTQSSGKVSGSAMMTAIQTFSIVAIWWAANNWKPTKQRRWWSLILILPLWVAGLSFAAVLSIALIGIMASMESYIKPKFEGWNELLCWVLPTIAFASMVVSLDIDVPSPVFVVWICLLATAWMTDYILRAEEENEEL
ncbi:hypothetical protein M9194_10185 [Vibrio sp. S4M6]|uniref:hypothetical protein n=1 Tax=Vibrio sinus TaxID=2946865 RepID=UPI00202AB647|nr:hypothetical protein [Vibrio sinus]MCL9781794.1 hypothetical protein [Vibrio sinus]